MDISVRFDSTQFIEESVKELNFTLIFSAILTAIVLGIGSFLGFTFSDTQCDSSYSYFGGWIVCSLCFDYTLKRLHF
ncbi:MAG: hypothetical protein U0T83_06815 [Bacteriovoracaceae bacterium]